MSGQGHVCSFCLLFQGLDSKGALEEKDMVLLRRHLEKEHGWQPGKAES